MDERKNMSKNIFKGIERLQRKMERLLSEQQPRMWFANPDLCLYLRQNPTFGWRYLIKIGAARGHLVLWFGWIGATVRW